MKEVLELPRETIDDRFGLRDDQGADIEVVGGTQGLPGGGFVLHTPATAWPWASWSALAEHARAGPAAGGSLAGFKAHPSIAPLVEGGRLLEYSAHLIPRAATSTCRS